MLTCASFWDRISTTTPVIYTCPYTDRIDDVLLEVGDGWFKTPWISGRRKLWFTRCYPPFMKRVKYQTLTSYINEKSFSLEEIEYIDLKEKHRNISIKIATDWEISKSGVFMICSVSVCGGRRRQQRASQLQEKEYSDNKQKLDKIYFEREI